MILLSYSISSLCFCEDGKIWRLGFVFGRWECGVVLMIRYDGF